MVWLGSGIEKGPFDFLSFDDLDSSEVLVRYYVEWTLIGIFLTFFSLLDQGYAFFEEKTTQIKSHFHHLESRVHPVNRTFPVDADLGRLCLSLFLSLYILHPLEEGLTLSE